MTVANCRHVAAFAVFAFCVFGICTENVHRYSIAIGDSILLECIKEQNKIQWKFQNNLLFMGGFLLRGDFSRSLFLLPNSSLYIYPISLLHIGKYECIQNKETMSTYFIDVQVPPNISIWFNNASYYNNEDRIYLPCNKSVVVWCYAIGSRPAVNISFTVDDEEISRTDSYTTTVGLDGKTLDTRTTILLHTIKESGNISCQSSSLTYYPERRVTTTYFTYVSPVMLLSKDGNNISGEIWLEENQTSYITCHALNSKPRVNLTWDSTQLGKLNATNSTSPINESQLFNSTSTIAYKVGKSSDTLTCYAGFEDGKIQWNTSISIRSYVPPVMSLSKDGKEIRDEIWLEENEKFNITCHALNSKPRVNLTWDSPIIEERNMTTWNSSTNESQLFNSTSVIEYKVGNSSDILTCSAGFEDAELQWNTSVYIMSYEFTTERTQSSVKTSDTPAIATTGPMPSVLEIIGVPLVIAILLIFSTITFAILLKKLFGHRTMTLPTDQRAQGNVRPLPLALISRELPPIYDQTDMINDDVAEQSIDDTAIGLNSEDVQLNFQLPGAGTMKYWVATYSSEGDKVTKIIAKSVSENARMKEILNFRALAKNATIMPRHQNIVDVLGVSLEDVPYFIYQEYIEYGTLKDFLMRNYQESSGGSSKQDTPDQEKTLHLTMFAADICEGMLFLKKQNCHHPGLAARKVLLSPSGRCKLYDFWPVDLAQDRVKQILDKKVPPLAWLAPETVFLGHFMEKSDIWNFGVVLWEIYSLGEIPFGGLTCAEIESKLRNKESLDQPLTCPGGIFGHMLATWNSAIDERPTFEHLNVTLSSFLYDMRESLNNENDNSEEPNYFRLDKDSSSSDDYIEHII